MKFIKKHFGNIIFALFLGVLFLNPFGLGMKIKALLIKITSFSPSVVEKDKRIHLETYNWKLIDKKGNILDFNQLKGKVVLVNYWATWCPPCVAEMPSIQKLYNDYKDKVSFVIVASDKESKVNPFIQKNNYTFPIFYEQTNSLPEFQSSSIPTTFLISKNGEIIISKKGAADWNSTTTRKIIDELL